MKLTLIRGPVSYPVSLEQAKDYCRIEDDDSDVLIRQFMRLAVEHCENVTGRRFLSQQWRLDLDAFEREIKLPYPNLISVDSIEYYDTQNTLQTLSTDYYDVSGVGEIGKITEKNGYYFPSTYLKPEAVQIGFTCGYADVEKVPECVKSAINTVIWNLYTSRGGDMDAKLVEHLLGPVIMRGFV